MLGPFTKSPAFKSGVREVFKKVDNDNSGHIDKDELTFAMSKLHFKLYKKSPGVTEPPSAEKVNSLLAKFDTDRSGSLTEDEFHSFASDWFDRNGIVFLKHVFTTSFLSMFALPAIADVVQRETPLVRRLPGGVFKVLFGVVFKLVAARFPVRA
ncbi:unnamed protein product [Chondrus crispus]|uniref:EF-hand domain-containing protein n=1 Tax=Chondrus crispus TaxID=2769 RepID=R7QI52_CHOCR|nr:unnamed protein product [Chondrus crispus]CDF37754.1 unnamed protein product [Chondrus crispus]|eukprot:XP_005717625.1 unnamed protein product [Chondrus crispus]